jgi:3-methyladenine DNA glycosylase AlkD
MKTASQVEMAKEIQKVLRALPVQKVPLVRPIRRRYSQMVRAWPGTQVIALAHALVDAGSLTERWVGYEIISNHREARSGLNAQELTKLGRGMDHWAAVDTFSCYLSGQAWRERQVSDKVIHEWARSPDRWWRRAALVSTVPLNNKTQGGAGDPDRTLAVARLLMDDADDMVVKAMSWALRELSKRHPKEVHNFLKENRARLANRVNREVGNKLRTGKKNPKVNHDKA